MRILLCVLLLAGCGNSENGRYQVETAGQVQYLLDTQTGCVWMIGGVDAYPVEHHTAYSDGKSVDTSCADAPAVK